MKCIYCKNDIESSSPEKYIKIKRSDKHRKSKKRKRNSIGMLILNVMKKTNIRK